MMWGWGSSVGSAGNEISRGRELNEHRDHFAAVYVQFPWLHDQSAISVYRINFSSGIQDGLKPESATAKQMPRKKSETDAQKENGN